MASAVPRHAEKGESSLGQKPLGEKALCLTQDSFISAVMCQPGIGNRTDAANSKGRADSRQKTAASPCHCAAADQSDGYSGK